MASIESYETSKGKRYRVRYRTPEGRQTDKRGFTTKAKAQSFVSNVEVAKERGEFINASDGKVTVGELGPDWLNRQTHLKPSTYRPLEIAWRLRVEPRWGGTPVNGIRPTEVQQWVAEMTRGNKVGKVKPLSATVVIRTFGVLAGILDDAAKDRLIHKNPARGETRGKGTKLPRKKRKRNVYLTHAQVDAFVEAAGSNGDLALLMCYSGARWGEATALKRRDFDLKRRRALIDENAVEVGKEIIVGTTKGHKRRTVPLTDFLVPRLEHRMKGLGPNDLMFPGEDGTYMRRPHIDSGWFDRAVAKAGIPRVTPHDLRHTAASLAVASGADVKVVQRMLGHASAAMTLDVYADLFDDDLDAVSTAMSESRTKQGVGKLWAVPDLPEESEAPTGT